MHTCVCEGEEGWPNSFPRYWSGRWHIAPDTASVHFCACGLRDIINGPQRLNIDPNVLSKNVCHYINMIRATMRRQVFVVQFIAPNSNMFREVAWCFGDSIRTMTEMHETDEAKSSVD